jgi:hypothetical protein
VLQLGLERGDLVGVGDDEHAVAVTGTGARVAREVVAEHVPRDEHDRAPEHDEPRQQRVAGDELEHRYRQRCGRGRAHRGEQRGAPVARLVRQPEAVRRDREEEHVAERPREA